jgi:hypothetical protein
MILLIQKCQTFQDIYRSLLNEAGDDGEIKNLTFQNLDLLHNSQFQLEDKDLQVTKWLSHEI